MSDIFLQDHLWCQVKGCSGALECTCRNYSGCSVDMAQCNECGKGYQVSYKIDQVTLAPDWDGETREETEARQREYNIQRVKDKRAELAELEKGLTE